MLEANEQFGVSGGGHYQCCRHLTGAQGHRSPQRPFPPKDRMALQSHHQGRGTCSSTKHLLARADPSAERGKPPEKRLRSACWSPELAGLTSQGEGTSSRAGRTNRSPTSPPAFLPPFLPLLCASSASLMSPDGHSCFRHGGEKPQWVFA